MVYYDHEYTRPREAKGGIRAQSKRGDFGASWWAKRWVQALENFSLGSRLARGRSYARRGQVVSIDVGSGEVAASVPGFPKAALPGQHCSRHAAGPRFAQTPGCPGRAARFCCQPAGGPDAGEHRGCVR